MSISDDFVARFPEFDSAVTDVYLPIVVGIYPSYYGAAYVDATKEATLQLLAHLIACETSNTQGGRLQMQTSKSVGSVSVGLSAPSSSDQSNDFFGFTKYGQRFLFLISGDYGGVFV